MDPCTAGMGVLPFEAFCSQDFVKNAEQGTRGAKSRKTRVLNVPYTLLTRFALSEWLTSRADPFCSKYLFLLTKTTRNGINNPSWKTWAGR